MIKRYCKKPVVIEAVQWTGDNAQEICDFVGEHFAFHVTDRSTLLINTLEGVHYASLGDYIIKGVKGEFYPCKPDIFNLTYVHYMTDRDVASLVDDRCLYVDDIVQQLQQLHNSKGGDSA